MNIPIELRINIPQRGNDIVGARGAGDVARVCGGTAKILLKRQVSKTKDIQFCIIVFVKLERKADVYLSAGAGRAGDACIHATAGVYPILRHRLVPGVAVFVRAAVSLGRKALR